MLDDELITKLLVFRKDREWDQFHTVRNLSASLVVEAAELLECFRWAHDSELDQIVEREREAIEDELADVAILLTYLCVDLKVDIDSAVGQKLKKNAKRYPVERARGVATKYDKL